MDAAAAKESAPKLMAASPSQKAGLLKPGLLGTSSDSAITFSSSPGDHQTAAHRPDEGSGSLTLTGCNPVQDVNGLSRSLLTRQLQDFKDKSGSLGPVSRAECDNVDPQPRRDIPCGPLPPAHQPTATATAASRDAACARPRPAPHGARRRDRMPNPPLGQLDHPVGPGNGLPANIFAQPRVPVPRVVMPGGKVHILGGLVEETAENKYILFAKQVQKGDPSLPYHGYETFRHVFFPYPPPDMAESNRQFDEEISKYYVPRKGLDMDDVEKLIDRYAAQTAVFTKASRDHHAELLELQAVVQSKKSELEELTKKRMDIKRERRITYIDAEKTLPPFTPDQERRLAEVAAMEEAVEQELKDAQQKVKQHARRGINMVENELRRDYDPGNAIDEKRTADRQKEAADKEYSDLVTAAAMMGLRGTVDQQDAKTRHDIRQFTQSVIDEKKKKKKVSDGLDDADDYIDLATKLDTLMTKIPEWFTILEAKGTVTLKATTETDRFKELMQIIGRPPRESPKQSNEQYHEPNAGWPNLKQRIHGGWWSCRSGPGVTEAERNCELCRPDGGAADSAKEQQPGAPSAADEYKRIMDEVDKAQAESNKREAARLKERMQQEDAQWKQFYERPGGGYHRQAGGSRPGGGYNGYNPDELLYGRATNQTSAPRQGVAYNPNELLYGRTTDQTNPARQSGASFQSHELLYGRPVNKANFHREGGELFGSRTSKENSSDRAGSSQSGKDKKEEKWYWHP